VNVCQAFNRIDKGVDMNNSSGKEKKVGFWKRMIDKLDKKLETKAKSRSCGCCCSPDKKDKGTC